MRLGYINGLRGLAILGVIWHHCMLSLLSGPGYPIHVLGLTFDRFPVLTQLWKGVDLFFILSGFVLYLPYVAGERIMAGRDDALRFYRHRAQRLLPLFLFAFLLVFSLAPANPVRSPRFYMELLGVPSLLFQFVNAGFMPPSFGVLWSVGIEILFSALFPLLIVLRRRLSLGVLLAGSLSLSLAVQLSQYAFTWRALQEGLPLHLFNFALGMAACEAVRQPERYRRAVEIAGRLAPALPTLLVLALLTIDLGQRDVAAHMLANTLFSVSAAGFVLALGIGRAPRAQRLLETRWLQLVGAMCYSIYLWHLPILFGLFGHGARLTWHGFMPFAPVYLALVFAVSALSYRYIEFPRADFRKLFFLEPRPAAPLSEPAAEPVAVVTAETGSAA